MDRRKRALTTKDLAGYIGWTPGHIRNLIHRNELPFQYWKIGRSLRFDVRDVDAWLDSLPKYGGKSV